MMKKYKNYIILLLIIAAFCISICFIPIDATRFIPQVEKHFEQNLGIRVHIEKLIFRFGPSLKIKAPVMHLMYQDGQKFGQLDNVKFFVPWSTLFKDEIHVNMIYTDKFLVKVNSTDKYLKPLLDKMNSKEYELYPNFQLKNYSILYNSLEANKQYLIKGSNLELIKLENYKNLKLITDGDFYINDKHYINYSISLTPNIEFDKDYNSSFNLSEFVEQVEDLDFHTDVIADLKFSKGQDKELQISGLVNLDNISVLDKDKKNPKSFIYLTFFGNKTGILSNIYASVDKKIYVQGVINNSKKPDVDLKVKTDEIKLFDIYQKLKLLVDCSKYKGIDLIDGTMTADFSMKGDLNKLKSAGYLKISDAVVKSGSLNIKNISSDIDFSNNVIYVSNAVGYVNNAPIIMKGRIDKNIDLELLMNKVELKHLLPEHYGIKQGIVSLNARISGNLKELNHKEDVYIENFKSVKNNNVYSFDYFKADTNKENCAYISNLLIKPEKTEFIKLPLLKILIDNDKLHIYDTNIFMPNSKFVAKGDVAGYNTGNFLYNFNFDGFVNTGDLGYKSGIPSVYPVKFNINGTNEVHNIAGQMQLVKTIMFNEPAVINLNAKYEDNTIKIEDLSLSNLSLNTNKNFKPNFKANKKLIISGNIENIKDPVLKNIRLFIPQQINLNIKDTILQLKGDLFINGKYNKPEIVGQISVQNIINQLLQLSANNLSVDFNKDVAVFNVPNIKISDSSAGINATLSTDFSQAINIKTINIKSKFLNTDTILMYKDSLSVNGLPFNIEDGKLYAERISSNIYSSPLYLTLVNSDFNLKHDILYLNNLSSELYNGKLAGKLNFNLNDENYALNIQGRSVSASPIFDIFVAKKDTISGMMDFDANINGNLSSRQTLNGDIKFIVHNGHMGTLGKLEHLLYAQNVVADGMLRTSLSVITKAITLKDTGLFKYLRGDITLKSGTAHINMMQSQGPLMSLYFKGLYQPATDYAKLVVLGRVSDEIISGLGSFGEFSLSKLMIMLTGEDNKLNIKVEDFDKIPQLPMKNTKEFRSVIDGIIEKPSSVVMFNWISYSQKALRQSEIPNSSEKVPDFIEALPY